MSQFGVDAQVAAAHGGRTLGLCHAILAEQASATDTAALDTAGDNDEEEEEEGVDEDEDVEDVEDGDMDEEADA